MTKPIDLTKPLRFIDSLPNTSNLHHQPIHYIGKDRDNKHVFQIHGYMHTLHYKDSDFNKCVENIPKTHEGWINLYSQHSHDFITIWETKHDADTYHNKTLNRIACIKITWQDGEGL